MVVESQIYFQVIYFQVNISFIAIIFTLSDSFKNKTKQEKRGMLHVSKLKFIYYEFGYDADLKICLQSKIKNSNITLSSLLGW